MKRFLPWLRLSLAAALSLAVGCNKDSGKGGGSGGSGDGSGLSGAGSTFVQPVMDKWAQVYRDQKSVEINYQGLGSGAGINQMTDKSVDFGCTDAFMTEEQLKKAEDAGGPVLHIPLVMGGVVPAYNIPGLDPNKRVRFTGKVLADIYLGHITKWNDPAILNLQEKDVKGMLPDLKIATVHRADSSGTTAIFTDYLSKVSDEWKQKVGSNTQVSWPPGGGGEQKTAGVAKFVKENPGSLGYIELTYALLQGIPFGSVQNHEKQYVVASLETVSKAGAAKLKDIPEDLRYSITNEPGKDAYPIAGTTWAILYQKQPAGGGQRLVDFLHWCTHDGQKYAKELKYAPLPEGLVKKIDDKLKSVKVGS
jgi:phosphate transport system substrate-binding protein